MKRQLLIWCLALSGIALATSCDDDDNLSNIPVGIEEALYEKYPNAVEVEWEMKAGYYVAEFRLDGMEMDVWYNKQGDWSMTNTDYGRNLTLLPSIVQTNFQASSYSHWTVDDIDKYECPDKTFYLIEVQTPGQKERNLFYGEDGSLLKDIEDNDNDDVLPTITF